MFPDYFINSSIQKSMSTAGNNEGGVIDNGTVGMYLFWLKIISLASLSLFHAKHFCLDLSFSQHGRSTFTVGIAVF